MQSTEQDDSKIAEIDTQHKVSALFFIEGGEQILSCGGGDEGILRRWRVSDGQEVGQATRIAMERIDAAALSPDYKWLVCAFGPSKNMAHGQVSWVAIMIWDVQTDQKVMDVGGYYGGSVSSIDISSDSTKFAAAGTANKGAFIWSMSTGAQLQWTADAHDSNEQTVEAVRFSPRGDRIATGLRTANRNRYYSSYSQQPIGLICIYNSDNGQRILDIPFSSEMLTPFAWSPDGRQLFAASGSQVKRFDTSSGYLLDKWSTSDRYFILSHNQRFLFASSYSSLSFWDTSTLREIKTAVALNHDTQISSIALSSNDGCIATGDYNGRITIRNLHNLLPHVFLTLNLPLVYVTDSIFNLWTKGDIGRVEELLTEEFVHSSDPFYRACILANRALVRARLEQSRNAIDDAKESIEVQRTVIGHIADAIVLVGNGEQDSSLSAFDLAFSDGLTTEHSLLLLVKAIILFGRGKCDDAVSRVDALIGLVDTDDSSLYITVRARMFLLLAGMSLRDGDTERATELLKQAREAIPFPKSPGLIAISLIFGWDFDSLALEIQLHFQECIKPVEGAGDAEIQSENPEEAILRYSTALTLDPLNPAGLLIKRSKARGMLGLWEDALNDADDAIKADPSNPSGYERRHAALHALQRYGEAIETFSRMLSVIEGSLDEDIRQLRMKYVSPSRLEAAIESAVRGVFKICPPVLIDVKSGRLCDGPERLSTFKSESEFKELVSSMTEGLDDERILRVVAQYFRYVTFSDVWEEKEPSFQDVSLVKSVWDLDSSPLNNKLKKFCEVVREDGYRWAWSDACVDKMVNTVLNQSLKMMYKWYEASAATLVLLAGVASPPNPGDLTNSVWMTQAKTLQVALAPKVVRFYDRDWKPYLGDTRANHKDSPEIVQELADAIGVTCETIVTFDPDDLGVRERLRLASTRHATVEEDVAYSLIGVFKSDIQPHYGEGDAALGHLLEEIVARSGDVTVLSWTGKPSPYHSCLPATLAVYGRPPRTFPAVDDDGMDERVAALRSSSSRTNAMAIYDRVTRLPPPRFFNRRLHLPCVIFAVKKLHAQDAASGDEKQYRARVSGVGQVEFQTSDSLFAEPFKLVFVHPWIRDLRDPFDAFTLENDADGEGEGDGSESGSESETDFESAPSSPLLAPVGTMDDHTRALRMVVRLQQPFHALLLQQQRNGQFKRVATEREIVLPGIERAIKFARDVRAEVVEIL